MFEWDRARKAKIDALAEQAKATEDARNTGRPTIPKRLAGSASATNSDPLIAATSSMPVEDRLLAYEERRLMKIASLKEQQLLEARKAATPKLAPRSMNLQRQSHSSSTHSWQHGADAADDNRMDYHNDAASYEESMSSDFYGGIGDDSSDYYEARDNYAMSRHSSSTSVVSSATSKAALKTTSKPVVHDPATGQLLFQVIAFCRSSSRAMHS